jgi:hypothetical protein
MQYPLVCKLKSRSAYARDVEAKRRDVGIHTSSKRASHWLRLDADYHEVSTSSPAPLKLAYLLGFRVQAG